jgi:hypothetical protein
MPTPSRFDLARLRRDLAAAAKAREGMTLAPGGRAATGLMALVRDNLDALLDLHASGSTWKEIAAGLTAQGYATADGRPLKDTQLTGVISSVRRQAARRAARQVAHYTRADLPGRTPALAASSQQMRPGRDKVPTGTVYGTRWARLAPELAAKPRAEPAEPPPSEAEIRQLQTAKHKHLFRKDPE